MRSFMILLKNCDLYSPKPIGVVDILIDNGSIVEIGKNIKNDCEIFDCQNKIVCPCFVDGHEHISYTSCYEPQDIINSGVGCVVGVLASEYDETYTKELINKTNELKTLHNIESYCLAGSKNCIYDSSKYIIDNKCVVGIKTALYTPYRPKPNLSYEKLKADAVKTYNAGIKAKKNVQVHIHLDHPFPKNQQPDIENINLGKLDNLHWIDKIVQETKIPYSIFKLTHAQKYYKRILEYANKGVYLDFTAFAGSYDNRFNNLLDSIKSGEIDKSKISISSDLGILSTETNLKKKETPITLLNTIQKLVLEKGVDLELSLSMVTINALAPIENKIELLYVGSNYPILILDEKLNIVKRF